MIPNQEKIVSIQGNHEDSVSRQMGLDSQSLPHLMSVLANLYSDSEMAVIREYSTNAYDSHVEAGRGHMPIQVTLPTVFSPEFIVRDFGVGMSEDHVFEVFGMYGASTKRESNDFTGQLGLGCKSAFSMTNQFSLTAIKDGSKRIFSVHLDEYGVGRITKLFEERTDAGNGVEVSIPVKDVNSFVRKAKLFYRFFPVMPTFMGGVAFPEDMIPEVVMEIDDSTKIIKRVREDEGKDFIVMGGVAYPYRHQGFNSMIRSGTVVMNAPMGAVDFTPSREELNLSKRTLGFIDQRKSLIYAQVEARIKEELAKASTLTEFKKILGKFVDDLRAIGLNTFDFEGQPVSIFNLNQITFDHPALKLEYNRNNNRLSKTIVSEIYEALYLTSQALVWSDGMPTDADVKKLRTWIVQDNFNTVVVVRSDSKLHPEYIAKFGVVKTLEEIKSTVKSASKARSKTEVYDRVTFVSSGWGRSGAVEYSKEVPDENEDLYYTTKKSIKSVFNGTRNAPDNFSSSAIVYAVAENQESKFRKAYPKAKPYLDFLLGEIETTIAAVEADEKETLAIARGKLKYDIMYLSLPGDFTKINDQQLARLVQIATAEKQNGAQNHVKAGKLLKVALRLEEEGGLRNARLRILTDRHSKIGVKEANEAEALHTKLVNKYPLMLTKHSRDQHLIDYANMIAKGE